VLWLGRRTHDRNQLPSRVLGVALGGAGLLSAWAIALSLAGASSNRIYLGTDTRAPAVLLGAALAAACARGWHVPSRAGRGAVELAAFAGVIWLAWAFTHIAVQDPLLVHGGLLLCGVAAVAIIAAVTRTTRGPIAVALSFAPLCWLGLISYGLYLWHWPVFVWLTPVRTGLSGWSLTGVRFAVSLAFAVVSYFVVEMPIRRGALRGWRIRALAPAAGAVILSVVLMGTAGAVAASSALQPARAPDHRAPAQATAGAVVAPRILIVGDSVGESLVARLDEVESQLGVQVFDGSQVGCELANSDNHREPASSDAPAPEPVVTPTMCRALPARWGTQLQQNKPNDVVVLFGFPAVYDIEVGGQWHEACDAGWQQYFREQATADVRLLGSTGAHVWVSTIAQPGADFFAPSLTTKTVCANRLVREVGRATHASVLDVAHHVCPDPSACGPSLDGLELRPDGLHFADPGGRVFAAWVVRQIEHATR